MALYNEILSGRFNEALVRIFGLKQPAPAPQLAAEIQAEINVGELSDEYKYLAQQDLWEGQATAPAAAAQNSAVMLTNPSGSGVLVLVERVILSCTTGSSNAVKVGVQAVGTAGFAAGSIAVRDSRIVAIAGRTTAVNILQSNNSPASTGGLRLILVSNNHVQIPGSWILSPGYSLLCYNETVNANLVATITWMQRTALPSELNY